MDKLDLISTLKKHGLFDNNPDYLSYCYNIINRPYSADMVSALKTEKRVLIHDVWNAYAYGNAVKVVYIKNRRNPKKNADFKYVPEKTVDKKTSATDRLTSSVSRARARVFELSACNEFQHFCTFTLNGEWRDRSDLSAFRKDLAMLVRNLNRGRADENKIRYVLIPEPHKKGGWHIHGLMSGLTDDLTEFKLTDHIPQRLKNMIRNGEKVYNFERYAKKFGYFTATEIKDKNACSVYLTKYITKELGKTLLEKGQHLFFASQGLKGREVIVKNCFDPAPFTKDPPPKKKGEKPCKQPADTWDFVNKYVKVKTISLSEKTDNQI